MQVIQANSVNEALIQGLILAVSYGQRSDSRNGPVLTPPIPVTTQTYHPDRRVLLIPQRNENPFFHFVESLWMLAGRDDLKPLIDIVPRMRNYSDDGGKTQPGAYGYRWRTWFYGFDQLIWAIKRLKKDPSDRRVTISMWDANNDPHAADGDSADVPCNTHLYLLIRDGKLDMTVCCRSNDLLWGAHGANAVHFSVLQEYLAAHIGVGLGVMWQVSNNYHLYEATLTPALREYAEGRSQFICPYGLEVIGGPKPRPLFDPDLPAQQWDEDLEMWWRDPTKVGLRQSFFRRVATPILMAHRAIKANDPSAALDALDQCDATDWRLACRCYIERKLEKWS